MGAAGKYGEKCGSLVDVSKQVLLDGKALVELIHNRKDVTPDLDDIHNNKIHIIILRSLNFVNKITNNKYKREIYMINKMQI